MIRDPQPQFDLDALRQSAQPLLSQAGWPSDCCYQPLGGGQNNRVFKLESDGRQVILKWYYSDRLDRRDRLEAETSFCRCCREHGVNSVPRVLGLDPAARLALFEFLPGAPFPPAAKIEDWHVQAAIQFILRLNRARTTALAQRLGNAAEACFSLDEHLACVAGRISRLEGLSTETAIHQQARAFVTNRLVPTWSRISRRIATTSVISEGFLGESDRCISPSDFGFHNALVSGRQISFVDFEYAGWDDPAKLVCDFFCQVRVPVPIRYWEAFSNGLARLGDAASFHQRCALLLPAYRVKWCCILLNEFLADQRSRRQFSAATPLGTAALARQLAKAEAACPACPADTRE